MPKRLVVPHIVSSSHRSLRPQKRGTRAFVDPDNSHTAREQQLSEEYEREAKALKAREKKGQNREYHRIEWAANQLLKARKAMADQSNYFVKPTSARIQKVRDVLLRHGILVETPMAVRNLDASDPKRRRPTDLGAGLELFERDGFRPIEHRPPHTQQVMGQIMQTMLKMHRAGISHNHLHLGNWAVNEKGQLKLLDLSMAKYYPKPAATKKEFLKRYSKDVWMVSRIVAAYCLPQLHLGADNIVPTRLRNEYSHQLEENVRQYVRNNPQARRFKITVDEMREAAFWK